jgi:hypothetical protein
VSVAQLWFEREITLSEDEYVRIYSVASRRARSIPFIALLMAGVASLFFPYTVGLGVVLLVAALLAPLFSSLVPVGAGSTYRRSPHLSAPMRCGVTSEELWVQGETHRYTSRWSNLAVWRETPEWIILSAHGMAPVFLRIADLRNAGAYEAVVSLAHLFGDPASTRQPGPTRRNSSRSERA